HPPDAVRGRHPPALPEPLPLRLQQRAGDGHVVDDFRRERRRLRHRRAAGAGGEEDEERAGEETGSACHAWGGATVITGQANRSYYRRGERGVNPVRRRGMGDRGTRRVVTCPGRRSHSKARRNLSALFTVEWTARDYAVHLSR